MPKVGIVDESVGWYKGLLQQEYFYLSCDYYKVVMCPRLHFGKICLVFMLSCFLQVRFYLLYIITDVRKLQLTPYHFCDLQAAQKRLGFLNKNLGQGWSLMTMIFLMIVVVVLVLFLFKLL